MILQVKRTELKYLISSQEAELLRNRLQGIFNRDTFNLKGAYFIRSIYFDNKSNTAFTDKSGGFLDRRKYRIRFYDFKSQEVKFEIKSKHGDMILKESQTISREDVPSLLRGEYEVLLKYKSRVLNKVYYDFKRDYFMPCTIVDYNRDAFVMEFNNVRITIDEKLRKSDSVEAALSQDLTTVPAQQDAYKILEVKYDHFFPSWAGAVLAGTRCQRTANSKYCLARLI